MTIFDVMNETIDTRLLKAYLDGTLSPQETAGLLASMKDDEEKKRYLLSMKSLAIQMESEKTRPLADTKEEWKKFKERMGIKTRSRLHAGLSVAACSLTLLLSGALVGLMIGKASKVYTREVAQTCVETGIGERVSTTLPDGSVIKMNSCSRLSYDPKEWLEERIIYFTGEGSFEITHDEQRPFLVNTERYMVKVLGTSFNLSSYEQASSDHISLRNGSVEVYFGKADNDENKKAYDLVAGHKTEVERALGEELIWDRGDDKKSSKIYYKIDGVQYVTINNVKYKTH